MFCPNCGKENLAGNSFCENCGSSLDFSTPTFNNVGNNMGGNFSNPQSSTNVCAIIGFVISLLGVLGVFCFGFFGIILGIAAIILGIVAKGQIKRTQNQGGNGLATAAVIIGSIQIALCVLSILALAVMLPMLS